ncbi:MAG: type II secretion system protein [Candidatus Paceibacterota bacterium]
MDKENKKKLICGFTLIEILFAMSIFIMILMAITLFVKNIFNYNTFISNGLEDVDATRTAFKTITAEIRTAGPADTGAYTIDQANTTTFSIYSDIDNDGLREKVRYFLDNGSIKKGIIKPTGSPLSYNPSNEVITTFIPYITNTVIFDYYDENYDGTTSSLPSPVSIPAVRLVKITVVLDKDINKPPSPLTMTTQVSIRNLKDNL